MAVSKKFDVNVKTLRGLLTSDNSLFGVPHYQRRYAWTKEQVSQLWDDILGALDERVEQEYFIGAVVFYPDPEDQQGRRLLILDGQQRIATLTIILAALRDHLEQLGEKERADHLHAHIVRRTLRREEEHILELRDSDGEYLKDHIQARREKRPETRKQKQRVRGRPPKNYLKEAYDHCDTGIRQQLSGLSASKQVERLTTHAEFVLDKVTFITTLVDSDTNAYIVFETMNDRGLELSIADLVKNHLFMLGEKHGRLRQMQTHWDQVTSYLEGLGEKAFSRFLRYYWLSAHEKVTQRNLFVHIKKYLTDKGKESVFRFASDLANEASLYSLLIQPSADDSNAQELMDLRDMGILQYLPLLLAAKKSIGLSDNHFGTLVSVCENLTMRYLIVGDRNPNQLETSYSRWARKLRNEGEKAIAKIQQEAQGLCPSDDEFVDGFKSLSELKTASARYILRKINEHLSGTEMKLAGPSDVHVEHILPQNPSPEWKSYFPDRQKEQELVEKLGNLTLLDQRLNKSIANQGFNVKVGEYAKSQIKITKDLCAKTIWNAEEIEKRQNLFAELASKIWSFDKF